ncbi:MAG: protein jag [Deltaproteobacteria bacterium]|nr:protein jag [Deltaproteobacteria bacterium]MBW2017055.1 protein jag [Deltaproteobacteria bacterium]MBW2127781.1 protein jag [Deltaproteobacteria bacterium]MBW2304389.1 protein jag [Deltaproteobacteria bacterium]
MGTYEFEGKTTEEAIQNASRELNLPVEELDIDIIEPGSAGIFGLVGGKKAKIRVTFKEITEEETEPVDQEEIIDNLQDALGEPQAQGEKAIPDETDRTLSVAQETLEKILNLIPVDATIRASQSDGKINLNIEGDRSGLLIGRKGKTLDALQFIVNKIVNKALDKKINVVVDSENYRKRREESLVQMAHKMGEKAKRLRKPITTNPMNPRDRRIVHLALKDDPQLDTRSRGEGLMKKVVIIPKK